MEPHLEACYTSVTWGYQHTVYFWESGWSDSGKDLGINIEEKLILVEVFLFLDYRSLDD